MSSNATLIGVLLFLVFVVPIVYAILKSQANKRKIEQLTAKLIAYYHLTPTDTFDDLGNHHFVLDANAKKLMHLEIQKSKVTKENMWVIDDIKNLKAEYSHYTSPSNKSIIGKIHLNLLRKDGSKTEILIYDENTGNLSEVDHQKNALENLVSKVNSLRN